MANIKIYFQKSDILGQKKLVTVTKWHINGDLCIIINAIIVY